MAYRLVENKGDSVAVPQLVIAKLPELEDDCLLYTSDAADE